VKPFICYVSFSNALRNKKRWNIKVVSEEPVFRVRDDTGQEISFLHSERVGFYRYGVQPRTKGLLGDNFIDMAMISDGDVVIDCGANIGEIGLGLRLEGKSVRYIAFEPGRDEAACCKLNNPDGTVEQRALWHEKTTLKFYEKSDTADSSLIEFSGYGSVVEVETTTLNDYCKENDIRSIKLLKIEGEGAEPEILKGAQTRSWIASTTSASTAASPKNPPSRKSATFWSSGGSGLRGFRRRD
jgi:FkbM family methyltransferase